jgi:hypothetical protein
VLPPPTNIGITPDNGHARRSIAKTAYTLRSSDVDSLGSMKRKVTVMFLGAALAAIVSFVGAGGCDDVQNSFNCNDLCDRYQSCFDSSYDTGACADRCENLADDSQNFDDRANRCQDCLNQNSCVAATFNCPDCAGIVP